MSILDRLPFRSQEEPVVPDLAAGLAEAVGDTVSTPPIADDGEHAARTASVAPVEEGTPSGLAPIPGRRFEDARAKRARQFARRISFVGNTYKFIAHQAARPPLTLERSLDGGSEWQQVPVRLDPWGYGVLRGIRPPEGTQADLVRRLVYLDDTMGEAAVIDVTDTPLSPDGRPAFIVRDWQAVEKKRRGGYVIKDSPNAKPTDGPKAYLEVPTDKVYRHWQADDEWELQATSSLIRLTDDLDTLWTLCRQLRRESRSRLSMNNLLWSPSEAHAKTEEVNGKKVSVFDQSYARMAQAAINDVNDERVASVAPMSINTPGAAGGTALPTPKIIEVPSLGPDLLAYIQDAREVVASALPLSSSAIFDAQQSKNHWGDWLADEKDLETIAERLRRCLDSLTIAILRPALRYGQARGSWRGGDPEMWRIGFNADVIRRTIDNSENVKWAAERMLINDTATREGLRLKETDAPTPAEFAAMTERLKVIAETTAKAPGQLGAAPGLPALGAGSSGALSAGGGAGLAALPAGGPIPNGGTPPTPAATASAAEPADAPAAALRVFDDRWMLGLSDDAPSA